MKRFQGQPRQKCTHVFFREKLLVYRVVTWIRRVGQPPSKGTHVFFREKLPENRLVKVRARFFGEKILENRVGQPRQSARTFFSGKNYLKTEWDNPVKVHAKSFTEKLLENRVGQPRQSAPTFFFREKILEDKSRESPLKSAPTIFQGNSLESKVRQPPQKCPNHFSGKNVLEKREGRSPRNYLHPTHRIIRNNLRGNGVGLFSEYNSVEEQVGWNRNHALPLSPLSHTPPALWPSLLRTAEPMFQGQITWNQGEIAPQSLTACTHVSETCWNGVGFF